MHRWTFAQPMIQGNRRRPGVSGDQFRLRVSRPRPSPVNYLLLHLSVLISILLIRSATAQTPKPPRAARSVHLGWTAPDADWFQLEMTVQESVPGSYFMACGWNTGYFGIQELSEGRKVVIFSVWDPTRGDNPSQVKVEDRVELVAQRPDRANSTIRWRRHGRTVYGWLRLVAGQALRFLLGAHVKDQKTEYAGYLFDEGESSWQQLVVFRVRTGANRYEGSIRSSKTFAVTTRVLNRSAVPTSATAGSVPPVATGCH